MKQIENVAGEKSGTWLRGVHLKRETEPLIITGQNKSNRKNYAKAKIDTNTGKTKNVACSKKDMKQ